MLWEVQLLSVPHSSFFTLSFTSFIPFFESSRTISLGVFGAGAIPGARNGNEFAHQFSNLESVREALFNSEKAFRLHVETKTTNCRLQAMKLRSSQNHRPAKA